MFAENRQNTPEDRGRMGQPNQEPDMNPGDVQRRDRDKSREPGRTNPDREGQGDMGGAGK